MANKHENQNVTARECTKNDAQKLQRPFGVIVFSGKGFKRGFKMYDNPRPNFISLEISHKSVN